MRRSNASFACALLLTIALPAHADDGNAKAPPYNLASLAGTDLKCSFNTPGSTPSNLCAPSVPRTSYSVIFQAYPPAGGSYSYAWTVPPLSPPFASKQSIFSGCTSTSSWCTLSVNSAGADLDNTIGVTVTDLATSQTVNVVSSYTVPAVCSAPFLHWC